MAGEADSGEGHWPTPARAQALLICSSLWRRALVVPSDLPRLPRSLQGALPHLLWLSFLFTLPWVTAPGYRSCFACRAGSIWKFIPPKWPLANAWGQEREVPAPLLLIRATLRCNLHSRVPCRTDILCILWPLPLPSCFPQSLSCPGRVGAGTEEQEGRQGRRRGEGTPSRTQPRIPISGSASGELHQRQLSGDNRTRNHNS